MRIALLANFYGPTSGGLRTAMHAIGAGYRDRGHEVLLVVPGERDATDDTQFGTRVTVASPVLPFSGGYRLCLRVGRVRRILREWKPDRIEVSDRTTLRGLGSWARKEGIPALFISHERADGVIRAALPSWLHRFVPVVTLANLHNAGTARRFATVVCTTAFAAEEFDRIGIKSVRIPLGVDLDAFNPDRFDEAIRGLYALPREALLVMASRLSREKRPDLAIDAVRILRDRGIEVRLVCAGTGAIAERIERRAEGLPVTFLGFLSGRNEYATLLACADVLVAPGPIETFGLAALEALASGTAVVANSASALCEVAGDAGATAVGTPEAFADAIQTVLARPAHERRTAARLRAEGFPWSRTVEALLGKQEARSAR
jgi:alpha-1,6-mannosyltransferase